MHNSVIICKLHSVEVINRRLRVVEDDNLPDFNATFRPYATN